jgi:hypothetical protein
MLTITTIYLAKLEPSEESQAKKIIEKKLSDKEDANRKLVVVYAGTNHIIEGRRE